MRLIIIKSQGRLPCKKIDMGNSPSQKHKPHKKTFFIINFFSFPSHTNSRTYNTKYRNMEATTMPDKKRKGNSTQQPHGQHPAKTTRTGKEKETPESNKDTDNNNNREIDEEEDSI